jgi:hypothetical protein
MAPQIVDRPKQYDDDSSKVVDRSVVEGAR